MTLQHVKTSNEGWVRGNAVPKPTGGSDKAGKLGQIPVGGKPIGDPIPSKYDHEKDKDHDRDTDRDRDKNRDKDRDRDRDRDDRFRDVHHGDRDDRRHDDDDRNRRSHFEERNINFHGHEFVHRTYWEHGVEFHRYYQHYEYRGVELSVYAPHYYYRPAFYGWAYAAWSAPVAWEWGWAGNPWFSYYAGWFRPYPVYSSPSLWLTDYLMAQTLEAGYEARVEAAAERRASLATEQATAPMSAEVKQAVAQEVRRQIALENAEAGAGNGTAPDPASSGIARMLNDHIAHIFMASSPIGVMSNYGQCGLSEGDVMEMSGPVSPNATSATLVVLASKGSDCRVGSLVGVGLTDLQDMHNHMRETLDRGLAQLQSKQGSGGIPAAPPAATKPAVESEFAAIPEPAISQQ